MKTILLGTGISLVAGVLLFGLLRGLAAYFDWSAGPED